MLIKYMEEKEIEECVEMYIDYYNSKEGCKFTFESASKKFYQFINLIDNRCYVLKDDDKIIGLALGYVRTYDDLKSYYLEEIVVHKDYQNQGIGSYFLEQIENDIKKDDIKGIELTSVNDEHHRVFYEKNGFGNVTNMICKVKWFF